MRRISVFVTIAFLAVTRQRLLRPKRCEHVSAKVACRRT